MLHLPRSQRNFKAQRGVPGHHSLSERNNNCATVAIILRTHRGHDTRASDAKLVRIVSMQRWSN